MSSAPPYDLVILNGNCFLNTDKGHTFEITDVGVQNGKIVQIGKLSTAKAKKVIDAKGLYVLPGAIDTQVHFREPGLEHKEDLATGTKSAALGGITTIFEMPNTNPQTITAEAINTKLKLAHGRAWVNFGFFIGAAKENAKKLAELERLPGCVGVKLFMGTSTGSLLVKADEDILEVFKNGTRRVAIHSEDEYRLIERKKLLGDHPAVQMHPEWRDAESAFLATRRVVALARKANRLIHVLHITTAEEIKFLHENKDIASVECTPQHLTLFAPDCYDRLGTLAQMNPPIRSKDHQNGLWEGIANGTVDIIGSDHAPHLLEEKQNPYPDSPSGMPGVQTLLPIMLNHVNSGRLSLERLCEMICTNPARIYGVKNKGHIKLSNDADFSIVDLKKDMTIKNSWIASKCGWTPFDGMKVTGWPIYTIVGGNIVMQEDQVLGTPHGKMAEFI